MYVQGEELGLGEAEVAFEDLQDPYGITFGQTLKAVTVVVHQCHGMQQMLSKQASQQ